MVTWKKVQPYLLDVICLVESEIRDFREEVNSLEVFPVIFNLIESRSPRKAVMQALSVGWSQQNSADTNHTGKNQQYECSGVNTSVFVIETSEEAIEMETWPRCVASI
jgi:hypothetical protein